MIKTRRTLTYCVARHHCCVIHAVCALIRRVTCSEEGNALDIFREDRITEVTDVGLKEQRCLSAEMNPYTTASDVTRARVLNSFWTNTQLRALALALTLTIHFHRNLHVWNEGTGCPEFAG
jgi:hypothetical protein